MSAQELFCEIHGPYDASLGSCPYPHDEDSASTGRPAAPASLYDDDELPTEDFIAHSGRPAPGVYDDDDPTVMPGGGGRYDYEGDDITEMPQRRRRAGLDDDDIDITVVDREDTSLLGWLVVKHSPYMRRGHMWKIKSGAIWGRDPRKADVIIDDDKVSGLHARIQMKDEGFVVIDLGSVNGTHVNDEEISGATPIKQDDEIKMGDNVFVLKTLE